MQVQGQSQSITKYMRNYTLSGEYEVGELQDMQGNNIVNEEQSWGLRMSKCGYRLRIM